MRRYLTVLLLVSIPAFAWAKPSTVIYICAHPDDCFLFMNPNLYDDLTKDADKVVIVYLTSGDNGLPFAQESTSASYPYVREQASLDATEWVVDAGKEKIAAQMETQVAKVAGHSIERVSYGNTTSYFMRLPDGNYRGEGFEQTHHESLHKLQVGTIDTVTPIDNASAYNWKDVVNVLRDIVTRETRNETNVTLHIQDPDTQRNTTDHTDHTTGGSAVLEALTQNTTGKCYTIYKHLDYSIAQKPLNLTDAGLQNKSATFAVLTATQRHFLDHTDWNEAHTAYLTRNYYTRIALPDSCEQTIAP